MIQLSKMALQDIAESSVEDICNKTLTSEPASLYETVRTMEALRCVQVSNYTQELLTNIGQAEKGGRNGITDRKRYT